MLAGLEHATTSKLAGLLSSVGFTPTNTEHLPLVLGGIWLLAITGFSPSQLLIGFALYVVGFPFTVLLDPGCPAIPADGTPSPEWVAECL
jgi:hypothetical protein